MVGDFAVSRVRAWPAGVCLFELMCFAHGASYAHIAADLVLIQDEGHLPIDLPGAAQTSPGAGQTLT